MLTSDQDARLRLAQRVFNGATPALGLAKTDVSAYDAAISEIKAIRQEAHRSGERLSNETFRSFWIKVAKRENCDG